MFTPIGPKLTLLTVKDVMNEPPVEITAFKRGKTWRDYAHFETRLYKSLVIYGFLHPLTPFVAEIGMITREGEPPHVAIGEVCNVINNLLYSRGDTVIESYRTAARNIV